MEAMLIALIRIGDGLDARAAALASIPETALPGIDDLEITASEFRSRARQGVHETFSLTVVVALRRHDWSEPRKVAFVIDGWRRRDLLGIVIVNENDLPAGGLLSRELAVLLDPPITETARSWRARARVTFELAARSV